MVIQCLSCCSRVRFRLSRLLITSPLSLRSGLTNSISTASTTARTFSTSLNLNKLLGSGRNRIFTLKRPTAQSRDYMAVRRRRTELPQEKEHLGTRSKSDSSQQNATKEATPPKVKLKKRDVGRLFALAKSEKLVLTAAVGCLVVSSAITMSVPFALGKILDIIFTRDEAGSLETMDRLRHFCFILSGVFVVGGLANFGRVYLFNSASIRIVKELRSKLYRTMLNQETGWFDTKGTGELVNRLSTDTFLVGNSLSQNMSDGLRSTVMIVAGTSMMIYTSPKLALISTCVVPCIAGVAVIYGRYVRTITRSYLDKHAQISKESEERLGNIKTVKSFCRENAEAQSYDNLLTDAMKIAYDEVMAKSMFFGFSGFSGNVIIISVLYYGGSLVISDQLTIGALTSFILYAAYSAISINGLSNFYTELNKGVGSGQRIWEILDRKYEISLNSGIVPTVKPKGQVAFSNVVFSFPARPENPVVNNLTLTLSPGQTTAIVGRSGSGKSTIASLLLRLYDPQNGQVTLDGMDLKQLSPYWLRENIGAVSQEPVLFSGTIRENIYYGLNPGTKITEDEFQTIVQNAHIDEFSNTLPDGLETMVGQRGMMLSGGQKQRVAIARALIKNPTILILDEATSALDSASEELVQNALEKLSKGRTVLTIAHRLSTIRNADKIAVLDNGLVAEEGSYDELIARETGIFKDLVKKQAFLIDS
ncbi:ATP-binding cassette sub-family B member 10, mitochondrial isoform X2 [Eupeodes corollae]|uniref:ATP-binding cassette sub-family B member 10, mitochondrial isoform X2 n=1 Tax=Eupeodes corollae TaxID=290404 RepID=UPI0024920DDA|nr:ATP-binding cassette sub-family B member 10, mitochondrial isoform X2 [Eupeodes corollae]